MEYIIFLTYRCNLKCAYCFANNVVIGEKSSYCLSIDKTNQIINYIKEDISKRSSTKNSIVFFGGEPTLVPELIDYFIDKTSELDLTYSIYTNGLLLDHIPQNIISKLNTILVAIDGDKTAHETYKPIGSYEKIINNVRKIKKFFHGELIARITMEENTNIFKSVITLLDDFDFVHWQIVNKPYFNSPETLIESYKFNINKLCNYWIESLSKGIIHNIIPFIEITSYLLAGKKNNKRSFWCGCGNDVMAIDINGNIYQCDEYINRPDRSISTIDKKNINLNYKSHTDLFVDCKNCNISSICLGRCRKSLETLPPEQIRIYCSLTNILIEKIESNLDLIKFSMEKKQLNISNFPHSLYNTEVIP